VRIASQGRVTGEVAMAGRAARPVVVRSFAALLRPDPANEATLSEWAHTARACDLPHLHAFIRGLELDARAVIAAVTLPFHNGRTEGVNTKTKMIKRQMYGRAGFTLLRHRILLG
jgi:transposase